MKIPLLKRSSFWNIAEDTTEVLQSISIFFIPRTYRFVVILFSVGIKRNNTKFISFVYVWLCSAYKKFRQILVGHLKCLGVPNKLSEFYFCLFGFVDQQICCAHNELDLFSSKAKSVSGSAIKNGIFIVPFNYYTFLTTGSEVHHSRVGMTRAIAQRCYSLSSFISKYDFISVFLITIVSANTYVVHELRELLKNSIGNFHKSNI